MCQTELYNWINNKIRVIIKFLSFHSTYKLLQREFSRNQTYTMHSIPSIHFLHVEYGSDLIGIGCGTRSLAVWMKLEFSPKSTEWNYDICTHMREMCISFVANNCWSVFMNRITCLEHSVPNTYEHKHKHARTRSHTHIHPHNNKPVTKVTITQQCMVCFPWACM